MHVTGPASRYVFPDGARASNPSLLQLPENGSARGGAPAPSPHSTTSTISTESGGQSTGRNMELLEAEEMDQAEGLPNLGVGEVAGSPLAAATPIRELAILEDERGVTPRTPTGLGKLSARRVMVAPRSHAPVPVNPQTPVASARQAQALNNPPAATNNPRLPSAEAPQAQSTATAAVGNQTPKRAQRRVTFQPVMEPAAAPQSTSITDIVKGVVASIFAVLPAGCGKIIDWASHVLAVLVGAVGTIPGVIIGIFIGVITLISGDGYLYGVQETVKTSFLIGTIVGGVLLNFVTELTYKATNKIFVELGYSKSTRELFEYCFSPVLYPNFQRLIVVLYDNGEPQVRPAPTT